jgi:two-component system sensor kinase FixL
VALTLQVDADSPTARIDRIQIEQVILNLLLNACEATASGPGPHTVELRVAAPCDGMLEIAVCDSGEGIDPATAGQVFEPFFTTKSRGLGMGLAISRSIVIAHDGELWLTVNPGRGVTFHFTLPMAATS